MTQKVIKRSSITGITYEEVEVASPGDSVQLEALASDPSSPTPTDGRFYLNTTINAIKARISGAWQQLVTMATSFDGDVSGTAGAISVDKWKGVSIVGTPTVGQVPTAINGTTASWQDQTGGGGGGGGAPVFMGCRVTHSSTQYVSNGTTTVLNFDSERFDTDGFHDTSTNNTRITIPTGCDGYYLLTAHLIFGDGGNGGTLRNLKIRLNGSTNIVDNIGPLVANNQRALVTTIYYLSEGDYVEVTFYQDSGVTQPILVDGQASPEFMVARLGLG